MNFRDSRLLLQCWLDLRSSGILRGVAWYLFTDVSGQRIGPVFKDQESEKTLPLKMGPIR
jgi:hypothetical protein